MKRRPRLAVKRRPFFPVNQYEMKTDSREIREIPLQDRPRERIAWSGAQGMSDKELLAVIIGAGTRGNGVLRVAEDLLALFDSRGLPGLEDLTSVRGIGPGKGALICAAFEFARRRLCADRKRIASPADILPFVSHYSDRRQEYFLCASLTGAHEIQEIRVVTMGILNRALVHPREVFSDPIRERAGAVIALHNHPSGNVEPSPEDREITLRLKTAGETLGIPLLDHIIFSVRGYYSFMEKGEL